jgi:hypothetical protein
MPAALLLVTLASADMSRHETIPPRCDRSFVWNAIASAKAASGQLAWLSKLDHATARCESTLKVAEGECSLRDFSRDRLLVQCVSAGAPNMSPVWVGIVSLSEKRLLDEATFFGKLEQPRVELVALRSEKVLDLRIASDDSCLDHVHRRLTYLSEVEGKWVESLSLDSEFIVFGWDAIQRLDTWTDQVERKYQAVLRTQGLGDDRDKLSVVQTSIVQQHGQRVVIRRRTQLARCDSGVCDAPANRLALFELSRQTQVLRWNETLRRYASVPNGR